MRRYLIEFFDMPVEHNGSARIRFKYDKSKDIALCEFYVYNTKTNSVVESSKRAKPFWDFAEGFKMFQEKKLDKFKEFLALGGIVQIEKLDNEKYLTRFAAGEEVAQEYQGTNCYSGIMRSYDYFKIKFSKKKNSNQGKKM